MFLPDAIDFAQSEKYVLSLRIKPDGWSFSIHEPEIGGEYCYREVSFSKDSDILNNIQRMIFDFNFLSQPFKQTNVVFVSTEYEVVPQYLFEKKKKSELYNISHSKKADRILIGAEKTQNNLLLYSVDNEIYQFLSRSLYNPQFWHHTDLLLGYTDHKNRVAEKGAKMYLNFHGRFLDIVCFDSLGHFLHAISYHNEPVQNIVYHILNLWDKCDFDQNKDFMYFIESESPVSQQIHPLLRDYISRIESLGLPSEVEFLGEDGRKTPLDLLILSTK